MYTLISGSPKIKQSNSIYFLNKVSKNINNYKMFELKKDKYNGIIDSIKQSDAIIFAFPLYVDSPTSITLEFLDYILDNNIDISSKKIYVIINCGFREGEQNITCINIIKRWCIKTNAEYCGSILIGAGEIVGKAKYKIISRKALHKFNLFSSYVKKLQKCEDIITTIDLLGNRVYCLFANKSWAKKCKINGISRKNILKNE